MSEVNEGVQIILNRMESNPEEFFGDGGKWNWIYKENMRDVMTEPEKAAIHVALRKVRRLEITAKAVATVMPKDEEEEEEGTLKYKAEGRYSEPKKMVINRAQAEMIKRMSGGKV
jgi:hypothetical protein